MEISGHWESIRSLFEKTFNSSFHYAIATVNEDGSPHITPIGSLILDPENSKGFYFEEYAGRMPKNLQKDNRVCVMAVNTSKWAAWKSFFLGRFTSPPAVRLIGVAGERREATQQEVELFRKRVRKFRMFKGYDILWGNLRIVREIHFHAFEPVRAGVMTGDTWKN